MGTEAVAEALAFAPTSIEALAADAQSGASWGQELRVCDPSPLLCLAIARVAEIGRAAVASGGEAPMDTASSKAEQCQRGESALDRLARTVLQSALWQCHVRQ